MNHKEDRMHFLRSLCVLIACATAASAADWPQWLGPTRDGVSTETVHPWKEPPKVIWRHPIGEGHSSPVVAQGRVFLHTKVKDKDEEELTAWDAGTGKQLWQASYPRAPFKSPFGAGPGGTPAVDGDRVYTLGVTGVLTCFNAATGKQVWQVDTLQRFGAKNLVFGVSCSPIVLGERVLVSVGGKGAAVVAFDKLRGEVLWTSLDDRASFASPIAFEQGGREQVVFLTQQGLVSLNPADGTPYWQFPLVDKLLESSATPVRVGDLLVGSSITYGSVALHLDVKEGKPAIRESWKNPSLTCYFSTPIPVGEQLYMVSGKLPLPGVKVESALCCVEARSGKELWRKPGIGRYHAAFIRTADNKLLGLDDASNLLLLDPNPKQYRELARSPICGETWAHPALSGGRLYVRDEKELLCVQLN
jgi:outer membrane protein assembly factor BamB